jgi:hypothetical protein
MTIEEAILRVAEFDPYQKRDFKDGTHITTPSGKVTIDTIVYRSFLRCPVCQRYMGNGTITIRHVDGRTVALPLWVYHYTEAEHEITGIDSAMLVAIMAEA